MNACTLGNQILAERNRFHNVMTSLPHSGDLTFLKVEKDSLQGYATDDPCREDGFIISISGCADEHMPTEDRPRSAVQVEYSRTITDHDHPENGGVVIRRIFYDKDDNSDPTMSKLETWHRDTTVLERDGTVLSDAARHTTAVYPGTGNSRTGVIIADEKLPELPLTTAQQGGLDVWHIAH